MKKNAAPYVFDTKGQCDLGEREAKIFQGFIFEAKK